MNFLYKTAPFLPLLLIAAIFIFPLLGPGLIVGGDWTFPSSNQELRVFGDGAFSIWSRVEIPLGTQSSHNNLYLFQILAKVWAGLGLDGISFQKIILFLTIIGIYAFSYRLFVKLTKSSFASIVGALSYLFSPIVFNYLNMGWNYVLLFLALAPLFTQVALDYFEDGKKKHIVTLGLISAISFFQSQSLVWLPLIFICIFISQLSRKNLLSDIRRFLLAIVGISSIVMIVHLPWLLPIVLNPNNIINSTSSLDLKRFSEVLSIANQFRLWGSLYNREFEFAFPPSLIIFSFLPIVICLVAPLFAPFKNRLSGYLLVLLLIIVAPTLFINRGLIADLPLSTVIRDTSRFLVITSLGVSLGIALTLSAIKNRFFLFLFCFVLLLAAAPYFLGRLYTLIGSPIPQAEEYRDFRAKLLILPEKENELKMATYLNKTNVFLPTGGFIFTKTDPRFGRDFWGIADIQSDFSPIATGIYYSEKSDPLVANFSQNYFTLNNSFDTLEFFFRLYGVDNLFYRSGLESTYISKLDREGIGSKCRSVIPESESDWAISAVCPIKDTYPLFYASVSPQYTDMSLSQIIAEKKDQNRLAILGCPTSLKEKSNLCQFDKIENLAAVAPSLQFEKISKTKYRLRVNGIKGKFLIIFNNTYHPGWVLSDMNGNKLNYSHLLVNQLVNGWVVEPAEGQDQAEYLVEFTPQVLYSKLLLFSLISLVAMLLYILFQPKSNKP